MAKRTLAGIVLALIGWTCYARPVVFEDQRLKEAVEATQGMPDPTAEDMLGLLSLRAAGLGIRSVSGLEYAINLQDLDLSYNEIADIRPLAGLSRLVGLYLHNNRIADFAPISGLYNLRRLDIHFNPTQDLSFLAGLSGLEYLVIHNMGLTDIGPLADLRGLRSLDIYGNRVSDLSPLAGLVSLECLYAGSNLISDIRSLTGLGNLKTLSLSCNQVSDIRPLAGLSELESLNLFANAISDVSPLTGLRSLRILNLSSNPLDSRSCQEYLPLIMTNNPGLVLYVDQCQPQTAWTLTVTCGPGGRILRPGQGAFRYKDGQVAIVQAEAASGFVFVGWTGTTESTDNPISIVMDRDYRLYAEFARIRQILYVDDDSVFDPGPGDRWVSDPMEDGSAGHPYDSIQEAVDRVRSGGEVVVRPGVYLECVDCVGRGIRLVGMDPNGCLVGGYPVIIGEGGGSVVRLGGDGVEFVLDGFIISRGYGARDVLVEVSGGRGVISHCIICGYSGDDGGMVVRWAEGLRVSNVTVVDNVGGFGGGGIVVEWGFVEVDSSIVWGNEPGGIVVRGGVCEVRYSDVEGCGVGFGNMDVDPLFVRRGGWDEGLFVIGDYHLRSVRGHWDAVTHGWVIDEFHSACIDGGDPGRAVGCEAEPNGGRVNMGAYGGTSQASRSMQE